MKGLSEPQPWEAWMFADGLKQTRESLNGLQEKSKETNELGMSL